MGLNYFEIADRAVGTAFLRPIAKMAAQCSGCGRAPPRPGCLLKNTRGRHRKPDTANRPCAQSPARLGSAHIGFGTEQHGTRPAFLTHRELKLTSCSCGRRSAGGSFQKSRLPSTHFGWFVCYFCRCHTVTASSVRAKTWVGLGRGWRGGGVVTFHLRQWLDSI